MRGPQPWCNWLIPGTVLVGAFPAMADDRETLVQLTSLLEHGVNSFVCLQAEMDLGASEADWRAGRALRCATDPMHRWCAHRRAHLVSEFFGTVSSVFYLVQYVCSGCRHRWATASKLIVGTRRYR
jgi:hypothetical protein